jgi:hypothetical protein
MYSDLYERAVWVSQHADDAFSKEDCMCIENGDRKYVKYIYVLMRCLSETFILSPKTAKLKHQWNM